MDHATRLITASVLMLTLTPGCASRTKTVTTETQVRYPAEGGVQDASKQPVMVEKTATTQRTTTATAHESRGVLSTAVHLVGEVLALPFRLIGGLLRLIF